MNRPRVVLVGTMGAGKTTVGRVLAEKWGVGFRDSDHDVEAADGRSVSDIFVRVGLSDAAQRVGLGVSRPLLLGNVRGRIKQLIDERTPVYESVATDVVDTDGLSVREVVEAVRSAVEDETYG